MDWKRGFERGKDSIHEIRREFPHEIQSSQVDQSKKDNEDLKLSRWASFVQGKIPNPLELAKFHYTKSSLSFEAIDL